MGDRIIPEDSEDSEKSLPRKIAHWFIKIKSIIESEMANRIAWDMSPIFIRLKSFMIRLKYVFIRMHLGQKTFGFQHEGNSNNSEKLLKTWHLYNIY